MTTQAKSILEIMHPGAEGRRLNKFFEYTKIAHDLIPNGSILFAWAYPSTFLDFAPWLFKAHVVQLVRATEKTRIGTMAEIVLVLHKASLRHPLAPAYFRAYEVAFATCRHDAGEKQLRALATHEEWHGRTAEIHSDIARKIRNRRIKL